MATPTTRAEQSDPHNIDKNARMYWIYLHITLSRKNTGDTKERNQWHKNEWKIESIFPDDFNPQLHVGLFSSLETYQISTTSETRKGHLQTFAGCFGRG